MYVTFKNNSTSEKMIISAENQRLVLNPETCAGIFCGSNRIIFDTQGSAFDELKGMLGELDEEIPSYSFKDRILARLTKKFAEKLPEAALDTNVTYEAVFNGNTALINLYDGTYSVCDGKIADALDIVPVGFVFSRAEAENGTVKILDADAVNRKSYLRLMRNILLFMHWGLIFIDLFLFVPTYLTVKYFSSHLYIKRLFCGLYNKTYEERTRVLYEKEQLYEKEDEKKGCLPGILKGLVVLIILGGICFWAMTSEPDVIISEDFSSVVCFDETFVKISGGLPSDAKDVFLEDYSAYYPLSDGSYDTDNYYCYIYETPDGSRYMWLKDNCTDAETKNKDYGDYENPLVYKSVGELEG